MARLPGVLQPLREPQPLLVDKQTAAKWQINCAIRNIFTGECPVSNHLIVMSTREVLDQYAAQKGVKPRVALEDFIRPEYIREARNIWKERYNFLKHSDLDADAISDFTNVQVVNENETFFNITKYSDLFGSKTIHMQLFLTYMMSRYPNWFNFDALDVPQSNKDFIRSLNTKKRKEVCELAAESLEALNDAAGERREVRRISFAEYVKRPAAEKDNAGKYFVRNK